jgi:prophage regulatory protein
LLDIAKEKQRQASEAGAQGDPYHHGRGRLPRRKEVEATTGLSKSAIYDLVKRSLFPPPVRLPPQAVAWVEGEVHQWIAERIAARDQVA